MQKITTFLMFNDKAEEAMNFYVSVFRNSQIVNTMPGPNGSVMGGTVELEGQQLMTFNGGPHFSFSQGISLFVKAETQEEIDHLYEELSVGGGKQQCGWVTDKFGVSWQIIPPILGELERNFITLRRSDGTAHQVDGRDRVRGRDDRISEPAGLSLVQRDRKQPVLTCIAEEDLAEAGRDHATDAEAHEGPDRTLARTAASEIRPRNQDCALPIARLIEYEVRLFRTVLFITPVREQFLPKID